MLVNMKEILKEAEEKGYAIGCINTPNMETLRAVVDAAEELNVPIIIDHAQVHDPLIPMESIGPKMVEYAKQAKVPVCVHLDHGSDYSFVMRAIRCGFSSIMYDLSALPFEENMAKLKNVDLSISTRMHIQVFSDLGNKLILNFYWELLRYIRFPYLANHGMHEERDRELLADGREQELEFMNAAFEGDFAACISQLLAFCAEMDGEYGRKEKVPFYWNIYWQRPQLCYTMASRIITEIIKGTYPVGGTLPSMPVMSKQLNVSYRTLRRTLCILDSLSIIRLHQGKVSDVCEDIEQIDFQRPEVKEGFRLYRESLQFMALTVRPVFLYTLEHVEKEDLEKLSHGFIQLLNENQSERCFKLALEFIVERCPSAAVRECYTRLAEFLVWGYPFALYRIRKQHLHKEYTQMVRKSAELLENDDWEGYADSWKALMEYEQKRAEKILADYQEQGRMVL